MLKVVSKMPSRLQPVLLSLATLLTCLGGCTQTSHKPLVEQPIEVSNPEPLQNRPFTSETLYSLLVAEMAGDRHRFDIMLSNYVQQAEATRDPGVTARAARLARYLTAHNTTLEMGQLWLELQPDNAEAHYIVTAELVHQNRLVEAVEHATFLLEQGESTGFDAIGARAQQGGDLETSKKLIEMYQSLLVSYPKNAALHLGASLLYQHAGDLNNALRHAQLVLSLEPSDFQAGAQETRVLQQMGKTEQALTKLGQLVELHPDNQRLRLQYARALLKTDLATAQQQFEVLQGQAPNDPDILLTLALIEHERGLLDNAKVRFKQLLSNEPHQSTANYYLGRIALVQKQDQEALQFFAEVRSGQDYLPAMSQLTELLVAQGQTEQALRKVDQALRETPGQLTDQLEGLYLIQSHIYTSLGNPLQALAGLSAAIEEFPESVKLLYSRAMLFAKLDKLDQAESDFMQVLAIRPDHTGAMNAWGYTLADRSMRLDEAYSFIEQAYKLSPEDPAIIDSMGWVEYRLGNIDKALTILRKALQALPDHEIAAHLGEVLWVSGNKKEALEVWSSGLKQQPDSNIIKQTMLRLNATLR